MNKDLLKSIIFHLVVAILLVISTWRIFARKEIITDETPIVVQLAPLGEKTNLKPAPKRETKPPQPKKPAPAPKKPEPKKPEPKKPEPKAAEKKPDAKQPDKKPDKTPDKKPEKKPDQKTDELDNLLKDLDKEKPEKSSNEEVTKEDSKADQKFDANSPEALAEQDYISKLVVDQIKQCWSPPAGAMNAKDMKIIMDVDIAPDGTMKFIAFPNGTSNDPVAVAAADSAKRAVLDPDCNPLKQLPPADKYSVWKEMRLTFNPKDMLN